MAQSVCFYFQVHQPWRTSQLSLLHPDENPEDLFIGTSPHTNKEVFEKVAYKCYLPMNELLLKLCNKYKGFRCSFSLSGVFLQQCEEFGDVGAQVLNSFQELVNTGQVEILSETFYHSLAFLYSKLEFCEQVKRHREYVKELFGVDPKVFRHTELIYNNELATSVRELGYEGIITEGWHTALPGDNPNYLHKAHLIHLAKSDQKLLKKYSRRKSLFGTKKYDDLVVLSKNYELSDDMAFRFGDKNWSNHPLHADTYANWIKDTPGDTVNLFMDFETFGEHQWEDTGIFKFFEALPKEFWKRQIKFMTPSETVETYEPQGVYETETWVSWADEARDISAWLENELQHSAYDVLKEIEGKLHPHYKSRKKIWKDLWEDFRRLQTSDHLYYMSTKYWADGDVHTYFSPYDSPYDAYINFMHVAEELKRRIKKA